MASVACPECKARYRVPALAVGKKAKCARCGATFVAHDSAEQPAQPSPTAHDTAGAMRLRCTRCRAAIKVPAAAAGRRVKCPKCAAVLRVPQRPAPKPVQHTATPAPDSSDLLDDFVAIEAAAPTTAPSPAAPSDSPNGGGPTCPSCGQSLTPDAKICVNCGINLKTGRSLIITQDENLDSIYATAERTIRIISWFIWSGIYPIASEAFGLCKPHVARGIALVTILASVAYFPFLWTDAPAMDSLQNLMLWGGSTEATADAMNEWRSELRDEFRDTFGEDAATDEELAAMIEEALDEQLAAGGEFQPTQLVTHAFLHIDILHLAGNLLFLMVLGSRVNALIGNLWTLGLYPLLAVAAGVAQLAASTDEPAYPMLGASGAVMGMAGMYFVFFPTHKVHMVFWWRWFFFYLTLKSFKLRGFWVVLFYIAFDVLYTALGVETGVAHWAHLGGFIAGMIVALVLLMTRLVNAHGGDLFSVTLGRHAWAIVGRPRT